MSASTPHRVRCIITKCGCVNTCPECGHIVLADWTWDLHRDPCPSDGAIVIDSDEALLALRDIGMTTALPCLPSCDPDGDD